MTNTRTAYTPIPASFISSLSNYAANEAGQLTPIKLIIGSVDTTIGIFQPKADSFAAIVGAQYAQQTGHTLTFQLGDIDISDTSYATVANKDDFVVYTSSSGFGLSKEISANPIIIGSKGKGLALKSSIAIQILLYVAEFKNFRF